MLQAQKRAGGTPVGFRVVLVVVRKFPHLHGFLIDVQLPTGHHAAAILPRERPGLLAGDGDGGRLPVVEGRLRL